MVRYFVPVLGLFVGLYAYQGCTKRLPHGGENPLFVLRGLHAAVPCEGCHGPGTPKSLSRLCIDCHEEDRPDPGHNPGQDCGACHTEDPPAWLAGVTPLPTGDTGLPPIPTGDTGPIIEPDPFHDPLPSSQVCMECHEDERKDPTHYANPNNPLLAWDCGPCHATGLPGTGWLKDLVIHTIMTPHGVYFRYQATDPARWVVACEDCHPDLNDYKKFECYTCHNQQGAVPASANIFPHFSLTGDPTYPSPEADADCTCCHEYGNLGAPNPNPCQ